MKIINNDKIGIFVVVIALFALGQLLYFTYTQREATNCQSEVNSLFLDTVRQRAAISDGDREAVRDLVAAFTAPDATRQSVRLAIKTYEQKNEQLDQLRETFEYPDVTDTC